MEILNSAQYEKLTRLEQIDYGKKCIDYILDSTSKKNNFIVIMDNLNPDSYRRLLAGCYAKEKEITLTTSKGEISGGLILKNNHAKIILPEGYSFKKIYKSENNQRKFATNIMGKEVWIESNNSDNNLLEALQYKDVFVTSDIDLTMIISPLNSNNILYYDDYGYCSEYEYNLIISINDTYSKLFKQQSKIITHGPHNRFHKFNVDHIKFPLQVFGSKKINIIHDKQQLSQFIQQPY